jgi:hypothetical protein
VVEATRDADALFGQEKATLIAQHDRLAGRAVSFRSRGRREQCAISSVAVAMTLPAEMYRLNAAECERECARATTLVLKRKYRDLAQQWREMAEQADRAVVKRTQRPERKNASP